MEIRIPKAVIVIVALAVLAVGAAALLLPRLGEQPFSLVGGDGRASDLASGSGASTTPSADAANTPERAARDLVLAWFHVRDGREVWERLMVEAGYDVEFLPVAADVLWGAVDQVGDLSRFDQVEIVSARIALPSDTDVDPMHMVEVRVRGEPWPPAPRAGNMPPPPSAQALQVALPVAEGIEFPWRVGREQTLYVLVALDRESNRWRPVHFFTRQGFEALSVVATQVASER